MGTTITEWCDRCGRQDTQIQRFKIEFNKQYIPNRARRLQDLETDDLCPDCANDWSNQFFNEVVKWINTKVKRNIQND